MEDSSQKVPEDYFERIVTEDLKRVFDIPSLKPRALFLCLIVDFWLGQLVFSPLIIAAFRGSWNNWEYLVTYLFGCGVLQSVGCSVVGALGMILLSLSQMHLKHYLEPDPDGNWLSKQQIKFFLGSRFFVWLSVCADTLLWKGLWELLERLKWFKNWGPSMILFFVLAVMLISTRSFNAVHCSPLGFGYFIDIDKSYMSIQTALQATAKASFWYRLLDATLTVILTVVAVCMYHSLWVLVDFMEGEEAGKINYNLFLFSLVSSILAYLLQFPNLWIHSLNSLSHAVKLTSHEITLLVTLVADVALFRAYWDLLDNILEVKKDSDISGRGIPSSTAQEATEESCDESLFSFRNDFIGDISTHLGCFFLLVIFRVSSSMTCGVKREIHRLADGIMIPRYYLTYLCSKADKQDLKPRPIQHNQENRR